MPVSQEMTISLTLFNWAKSMEKYKRKPYSVQTDSAISKKKAFTNPKKIRVDVPKVKFTITSHCCIKQRNSALKLQLNLKHILNLK